jgi:RsiW-degrading membrane proteinase PrsW (M82 family)
LFAIAVLAVSVAPAVAFLAVIVFMDRREREPLPFVLRIMALGGLGAVVAALVEILLARAPLFALEGLAGAAVSSFVQIAPVEELCKIGVVLIFAWRNPNFNEENDGIVYTGASAVGFALLENVAYVSGLGIGTGILRAFSSIPLHVFTGVAAGYFIGRARFTAVPARRGGLLLAGFALAYAVHGLYDTFAMSGSEAVLLLFPLLAGLSALGIVLLKRGRKLSLARWGGTPDAKPARPPEARRAPVWMAIISRLLMGACALFWLLLLLGGASQGLARESGEGILGGILLTILPASLGVLLEITYHSRKRRARKA